MAKVHRLLPNTEFAKAFRVQRVIGEGAMGTVYLVTRLGDGKDVALKVLKPSIAADDDRATARFAREAIVGDRIGNDHVVDVLDAGFDDETGLHWLSMEYLDGMALPAYLDHNTPTDDDKRTLVSHLFDAMAAAHRAGVLHRDLKPENIVVAHTTEPVLKVLDFGVAKTFAPHMGASATEGGLGTPLWAAPEQGKGGTHMRPSVDVWALGLLTFFIFTGKIYWQHANEKRSSMLDIAQEMLLSPIVLPSERAAALGVNGWPPALDTWFMTCVDRDAAQRFPDADHARAALFPHLGLAAPAPAPVAPSIVPPALAAPAPPPTSPVIVVVVVALVVFGIGALLLFL